MTEAVRVVDEVEAFEGALDFGVGSLGVGREAEGVLEGRSEQAHPEDQQGPDVLIEVIRHFIKVMTITIRVVAQKNTTMIGITNVIGGPARAADHLLGTDIIARPDLGPARAREHRPNTLAPLHVLPADVPPLRIVDPAQVIAEVEVRRVDLHQAGEHISLKMHDITILKLKIQSMLVAQLLRRIQNYSRKACR